MPVGYHPAHANIAYGRVRQELPWEHGPAQEAFTFRNRFEVRA